MGERNANGHSKHRGTKRQGFTRDLPPGKEQRTWVKEAGVANVSFFTYFDTKVHLFNQRRERGTPPLYDVKPLQRLVYV